MIEKNVVADFSAIVSDRSLILRPMSIPGAVIGHVIIGKT